jgi:hypothetical protein
MTSRTLIRARILTAAGYDNRPRAIDAATEALLVAAGVPTVIRGHGRTRAQWENEQRAQAQGAGQLSLLRDERY